MNLATQTEVAGETGPHGTKIVKPPLPVEEVAKLFPQLEILECLGRGGMGAVYKARQSRLDRVVALKILSPEKQGEPKFAERFEREARALAKLHHPNIVTVYDFGETQGNFYLLMEFVDGLTLRQLFQARKLSPAEALGIVPKICEALQYAHEQGIVHRDIKPENILLAKNGCVKIADFGIAKILGSDGGRANLTEEQAIGTPHYMSPEQIEKPQTVDHRADIYSLGVVFYEMLTGELPLGKFAAPSSKVQIDVRLDEVVLRALEKEPARRYQHASEVKTQIETIVDNPAITHDLSSNAKVRPSWWPASPLSSSEVRDITAHFTKTERSEFSLNSLLCGFWVTMATLGNFLLVKFYPSPGNWILPLLIIMIFIVSFPPMIRMQKRFLCSTAWAKKQNYTADKIKLFSFSWSNFPRVWIFAATAALLIFAQNKMFLHLSGTSELTVALKEDAVRTKELSAQLAARKKSDYIGQSYFPEGDSIEITSVERTENQMTVKGRYKLVSHDSATLALYVTTKNDIAVPTDSKQQINISKGGGDFELTDSHLVPGLPHVSMYADGHSFAALYFGNKQEAAEEREANWITNSSSTSAKTSTLALNDQPPVVVETFPVSGAREVAPGETEIRVRFSKEMTDGSWSWSTAWENSTPAFIGQPHYEPDARTCIVKARLEPDKTYAFWLNSENFHNFKDADGRPAVPYLLIFHTKPN